MSAKQFEQFIVEHFIGSMEGNIVPGYKYQYKSPNHDNSAKLYRAFIGSSAAQRMEIENNIVLHSISISGVNLITVMHKNGSDEGFTENFISYLRDEISSQKGLFHNSALLIIHNSLLDTLVNSSKDIASKKEPFSPTSVKNSLEKYISEKDSPEGRRVSKLLLDHQFDLIVEDEGSMFGFELLHRAISDGDLRFSELGMLNDPAILSMDNDEQIRKRLAENKALYGKIEKAIEYYPDQLKDNLPDLSGQFIDKYMPPEDRDKWKRERTFDDFDTEVKNSKEKLLEVTSVSSISGTFHERFKGSSKAGKKERYIIIEVEPGRSDFDLNLDLYGAKVEKKEVQYASKNHEIKSLIPVISGGSKNTSITLTGNISDTPLYFRIELKRNKPSEKFKFRCLVVREGWFNIDQIRNFFVVNDNKQYLTLQTQETEICIGHDPNSKKRDIVTEVDQVYDVNTEGWINFEEISNDVERITFAIKNGAALLNLEVEGASASDSLVLPLLFDKDRKGKLFKQGFNGTLNESKKRVYVENSELKSEKSQIDKLLIESGFVEGEVLYQSDEETLAVEDYLADFPELASAYRALFEYLQRNNSLPSLCGWDEDYINIVNDVVAEFIHAIESITINQYLDAASINLMKIGFYHDISEWLTPIHPLVLAYLLELVQRAKADCTQSFFELPKVTMNRLNAQGLLPYLFDFKYGFSYVQADLENSGWLKCVPNEESEYGYIPKLVKEKVREFAEAYRALFDDATPNARPTMIINSVNSHDNHGLFIGLVEHFSKNRNKPFNIHVNLYDDELEHTEFDYFSEMGNYEKIKARYGLNKADLRDHSDVIVDTLRTRLTYSKFRNDDVAEQAYSHLCFYRNNEKVEVVDANPDEKLSGISANGLINGEASSVEQMNYITGFGTRKIDVAESKAVSLALGYSRLIQPARKETVQYRESSAIALAVNSGFRSKLERCYESSIWTTIIDPKVTLDFFESDSDTLLIHYSDQYTSSSGYDAITVTRQTKMFSEVIARDGGGLVSEFNAFNGEWLLKLLTDNEKLKKEHKGILSAYKLVSILLSKSDITWVPISVAEMVRVSGNIGLKMTESEFARHIHGYKSGAISDDVLFIGFKDQKLYLLPLEVKTGKSYDAQKALKQAKELKRYLTEVLSADSLAGKLYRSLFVRQALLQVDKYELYDVFDEDYFKRLSSEKEWWLQGNYELADVPDYVDGFVVANLEPDKCYSTSATVEERILKIVVPSSFIENTISTPLKDLWENFSGTPAAAVQKEYFLTPGAVYESILSLEEGSDEVDCVEKKTIGPASLEKPEKVEDDGQQLSPQDTEIFNLEKSRVLIGKDILNDKQVFWEYGHKDLANRHLIVFGRSGQGKTYCIQGLLMELSKAHCNSLIIDYTNGFLPAHLEAEFNEFVNPQSHFLAQTPLGISPFRKQKQDFGGVILEEKNHIVAGRIASVFNQVYSTIGEQQLSTLMNILEDGVSKHGSSYDFACMLDDLREEGKVGEALANKLSPMVKSRLFNSGIEQSWQEIFGDDKSKTNIIQLASFSKDIMQLATEFTLWDLYAYACSYGNKFSPLPIVLDEVQNLDHRLESPLGKMLTEGRKYGISLILATQTLSMLAKEQQDRLFQAAHKLFFAPAETEIQSYAKLLEQTVPGTSRKLWLDELAKLKKGECISVGLHMNEFGVVEQGAKVVKVSPLEERL